MDAVYNLCDHLLIGGRSTIGRSARLGMPRFFILAAVLIILSGCASTQEIAADREAISGGQEFRPGTRAYRQHHRGEAVERRRALSDAERAAAASVAAGVIGGAIGAGAIFATPISGRGRYYYHAPRSGKETGVKVANLAPPPDRLSNFIPWPPPRASTFHKFPPSVLAPFRGRPMTDVARHVEASLANGGYTEYSYFRTPDGFSLATRLERVDEEGGPSTTDRWTSADIRVLPKNLKEYFERLISSEEGRFRTFVFVVTSDPSATSEDLPSYESATRWSRAGARFLDRETAALKVGDRHIFYVLCYEYVGQRGKDPKWVQESKIPAAAQLSKSSVDIR